MKQYIFNLVSSFFFLLILPFGFLGLVAYGGYRISLYAQERDQREQAILMQKLKDSNDVRQKACENEHSNKIKTNIKSLNVRHDLEISGGVDGSLKGLGFVLGVGVAKANGEIHGDINSHVVSSFFFYKEVEPNKYVLSNVPTDNTMIIEDAISRGESYISEIGECNPNWSVTRYDIVVPKGVITTDFQL